MFTNETSKFSNSNDDMNTTTELEVTASDPLDDVFGADSDDGQLASEPMTSSRSRNEDVSDVPRLQGIHTTNGYREGVAASKEKFLQEGFDEGYSLGGEIGAAAGRLVGILESLVIAVRSGAASAVATELGEKLASARSELSAKSLYAPDFFGEDGIWKYEVATGDAGEDDVTFRLVANGHPSIKKWTREVEALCEKCGLRMQTQDDS